MEWGLVKRREPREWTRSGNGSMNGVQKMYYRLPLDQVQQGLLSTCCQY